MKLLNIQSVSDIITNSSSEVFIVNKEDFLYYIDVYDGKNNECFNEIKKLTSSALGLNEFDRYLFSTPNDIMWSEVLSILRIPEEQAIKEGLRIEKKSYYRYTDPEGKDVYDDYYVSIYDWELPEKERKKQMDQFFKSWIKFTSKHEKEIKNKIVGTYYMNVEDHFDEWPKFKEEIVKNGYLYRECCH